MCGATTLLCSRVETIVYQYCCARESRERVEKPFVSLVGSRYNSNGLSVLFLFLLLVLDHIIYEVYDVGNMVGGRDFCCMYLFA